MKEPPNEDSRCHYHQAESLITHKVAQLLCSVRLLGHLLVIRLDASLHHGGLPGQLFHATHFADSMAQRFQKICGQLGIWSNKAIEGCRRWFNYPLPVVVSEFLNIFLVVCGFVQWGDSPQGRHRSAPVSRFQYCDGEQAEQSFRPVCAWPELAALALGSIPYPVLQCAVQPCRYPHRRQRLARYVFLPSLAYRHLLERENCSQQT